MKDLHTIKSKTVAPLLQGAFAQSRYGEEVLAANGLPPDIMSGGDFVLPKFAICAAADQLARREADPNYVFQRVLESPISAATGRLIECESPDSRLESLCSFTDMLDTDVASVEIWWEIDGAYFWFKRRARSQMGKEEFVVEIYALAVFLQFLKVLLPDEWKPAWFFTQARPPTLESPPTALADRCHFGGSDTTAVAIPLERFLAHDSAALEEWSSARGPGTHRVVSAAQMERELRRVVDLCVISGRAELSEVAAVFGLSPRSFQRQLSATGLRFRSLVNESRHTYAAKFLRDSTLKISEIAARLGYSQSADFTRAFGKHTGLAPSDYREHFKERQFTESGKYASFE
jgi:AraC-like DNA-binding protein